MPASDSNEQRASRWTRFGLKRSAVFRQRGASIAAPSESADRFIGDCPDDTIYCLTYEAGAIGTFENQGFCWSFGVCVPCEPYGHDQPDRCSVVYYWNAKCNAQFPACNGKCWSDFASNSFLCWE